MVYDTEQKVFKKDKWLGNTSKHVKHPLAVRQMQIGANLGFHLTQVGMALHWNPNVNKCWHERMEKEIVYLLLEWKTGTATIKTSLEISMRT